VRKWTCAAAVFAAAGCSTVDAQSASVTWSKPGVDVETMRLEYGLCGGDFTLFGAPRFAASEFADIDACMRAKGFTREER
jgi:hypothetical protein